MGGSPDRVEGGLPTGGQGSKGLCAVCRTQGTETFSSGYPAGRIGDRGDREIVYVPNVYVPFPAPNGLLTYQTKNSEFRFGVFLDLLWSVVCKMLSSMLGNLQVLSLPRSGCAPLLNESPEGCPCFPSSWT